MQAVDNVFGMTRTPDEKPADKKRYLAARVAGSLVDALQKLADADKRSLSFMAEEAIREYVHRHHPKKPDNG